MKINIMMSLLRRVGRLQLVLIITTLSTILLLLVHMYSEIDQSAQYNYRPPPRQIRSSYNYDAGRLADAVFYDHNMPLIWVGGVPRSGTTLARVMLDAHPDIRCGEETRIIPRLLAMHGHLAKSEKEMSRLKEAKITEDIMDEALGAYLLNIIIKHGEPAQRLCNKDPFALKSIPKLLKIFPNSKFVLMVRDGRATVHSIISRKVTIRGFDTKSYRGALRDWNRAIETMYTHCQMVGPRACLMVKYEELVLHPEGQMRRLLGFLGVPWNSLVLHHQETLGKNGGVSLSRKEPSTDQVKNPVNTGSLTTWVESIPDDLRQDMESVAPMLSRLGYDPTAYPPNYGTPDKMVQRQSASIELELKAKKILHMKNEWVMTTRIPI